MTTPPRLGQIVRAARAAQGLTLAQVSERSGVSRSMLSAIERDVVNPTFSVVWALCQALDIDLASLEPRAPDAGITHQRAFETPSRTSEDGLCEIRMLSPRRSTLSVEWHELRFAPGGALVSAAHAPGTIEHLTCLDGTLSVETSAGVAIAGPGDTLRYASDTDHAIRADHDGARALLLVMLPA